MDKNSVGFVKTRHLTCCEPPDELALDCGLKLGPVTQAYETYGTLNEDKSNAILVFHALSGDAHAAGWHEGDKKPGWWDGMIGPGKAIDTGKYFVICINILGSCKGTSGPASVDPKNGRPYGLNFPMVTIGDMVKAQKLVVDHLGIKRLLSAIGGSLGGLEALKWATLYPDSIASSVLIAANMRQTAQQIALHEVARQAIMSDPDWRNGEYYGKTFPSRGLALSRMIGHITFMSDKSMEAKFGRELVNKEKVGYDLFSQDFQVESYLRYQGNKFTHHFDANSYLYISKALDYFDITQEGDLRSILKKIKAEFLVLAFTSDWLYPPYQTQDMVKTLKNCDVDVSFCLIDSHYGHDAFLVEIEQQSRLIPHFLDRVQKKVRDG